MSIKFAKSIEDRLVLSPHVICSKCHWTSNPGADILLALGYKEVNYALSETYILPKNFQQLYTDEEPTHGICTTSSDHEIAEQFNNSFKKDDQ